MIQTAVGGAARVGTPRTKRSGVCGERRVKRGLPARSHIIDATKVHVGGREERQPLMVMVDVTVGDYGAAGTDGMGFATKTAIEQHAVLALTAVPGSVAIDPTFGNTVRLHKKDHGDLPNEVLAAHRTALAALVKKGSVRAITAWRRRCDACCAPAPRIPPRAFTTRMRPGGSPVRASTAMG